MVNCSLFFEILARISFTWKEIVKGIRIYTKSKEQIFLSLDTLKWNKRPTYPSCILIDVAHESEVKKKGIRQIFFDFYSIKGIGVEITIEDRNLVCSRTLKNNLLSFTGPTMDDRNLKNSMLRQLMFQFSQNKFVEDDKSRKCEVYPNKEYSTYNECDAEFMQKTIAENFPFLPVWATDDIDNVTKHAVYEHEEHGLFHLAIDLFDGTEMSPCPLPC